MDTQHPPFHSLADLAEGLMHGMERETVERHVWHCETCSADIDWLQDTIGLMRADTTESAPEHVINRAVRLFAQYGPGSWSRSSTRMVERLVGVLRFDSAAGAAAGFGVRHGGDDATRQMIFEAEPFALDLRTRTSASGSTVAGQLLGPDERVAYGDVELIGPKTRVHAPLTELLEFSLPTVPAGTYRLEVRLDHVTAIEIPAVVLGSTAA